jgi:uncharacterized protein (TIGR03492 family)
MSCWLIVCNGHGEDQVAAALAAALRARQPGLRLAALPLVGRGAALEAAGVDCLGPRAVLPSAGLTLHHPAAALADLRAGLVRVTLAQLTLLRRARPDHVLVVGDLYAHALAALVPAPRSVVQTLVSVHMQRPGRFRIGPRSFMERVRWPERRLMRGRVRAVYARDELTAAWLRRRGIAHARYLGNPMVDAVGAGTPVEGSAGRPAVALLPGTRPYAHASVGLMLAALASLGPVLGLVAWTHGPPAPRPGWVPCERRAAGLLAAWRWQPSATEPPGRSRPSSPPTLVAEPAAEPVAEVWWLEGRFADVLASARAVLGTTGTAQEQAAGLGLPVVSFPVRPDLSSAFLRNQQRLLGSALQLVPPDPASIAAALREALADGPHRRAAARDGPARMGPPGAADRIADDLLAREAGLAG